MNSISVVVPTYNGAHKVQNALRALSQQSLLPNEIIVVIDGSTDQTGEKIHWEFIKSGQFQALAQVLCIIEQPNGGRAASRNRGAKEATGDLLIFFDDDVRPSEHTVDLHVQHHRQYQNTILVGNVPEDLQLMKTDFQRYKSFLSHKWVTSFSSNNNCIKPAQPYITAANFSIPRRLFFELGGFDEQLTDAEDYDLAMRAAKSNIPIYFNSEAVAWHDDFITCRSYIQRLRQYAIARKKLIDLKPAYYQERGVTTTSWKMNLFRMFAGKFWVDLIDSNRHTLLMPQFIRYKFYDIVTTGLGVYFTNKKF